MPSSRTTIAVQEQTRDRIANRKADEMSFDQFICKMLEYSDIHFEMQVLDNTEQD